MSAVFDPVALLAMIKEFDRLAMSAVFDAVTLLDIMKAFDRLAMSVVFDAVALLNVDKSFDVFNACSVTLLYVKLDNADKFEFITD